MPIALNFLYFFSNSKKLSVSDFTRTHFLIFEKTCFQTLNYDSVSDTSNLTAQSAHSALANGLIGWEKAREREDGQLVDFTQCCVKKMITI